MKVKIVISWIFAKIVKRNSIKIKSSNVISVNMTALYIETRCGKTKEDSVKTSIVVLVK